MDLPRNALKAALRAGELQFGLWCTLPSSGMAELLAGCGFDWLLIDTEHSTISLADVHSMLQAMAPYPVTPVVRAGWNDMVEIKRILDVGAQSILVPYVEDADEARAAAEAVRYPPLGKRGAATLTRAARYGQIDNYIQRANDEICLIVQAESSKALANLEEIAAVDGVDAIFIGPADLAASMGHPGNSAHPDVQNAIHDAIRRIRAAGVAPGMLSDDQDFLRALADDGAQLIAQGLDLGLLGKAARTLRADW